MDPTPAPPGAPDDPHWIEIFDTLGQCPLWQLGPFAHAREAERMARGVNRLINTDRFTVRIGAPGQAALHGRPGQRPSEGAGPL